MGGNFSASKVFADMASLCKTWVSGSKETQNHSNGHNAQEVNNTAITNLSADILLEGSLGQNETYKCVIQH